MTTTAAAASGREQSVRPSADSCISALLEDPASQLVLAGTDAGEQHNWKRQRLEMEKVNANVQDQRTSLAEVRSNPCQVDGAGVLSQQVRWAGKDFDSAALEIKEARVLVARRPEIKYSDGVVLELSQAGTSATATKTRLSALKTRGGLIQAYELNGKDILFLGEREDQLDGSIFWPSPQSKWGWPPPPEIDPTPSKDYTAEYILDVDQESKSFTLTSPVCHKLNLQVSKRISIDPERAAVVLDASLINTGEEAQSWAPWEVSRVRPNGMTFYATGSLPPFSGDFPALPVTEIDGITWFMHSVSSVEKKLFADTSQGWIAHTDGELVLVQCFEKIPADAAAPGEQQIEIYDGGSYVEVEVQGAYMPITPGGRLTWNSRWYLREMPPEAVMVPGDKKLVSLVTGLCNY